MDRLEGVRAMLNSELWIGHPMDGEILPEPLHIAMPKRDRNWVWVAYIHGEAIAAIYAADFHGIVFLSAIRSSKKATSNIVMKLFREIARSTRRRGYTHFLVFLGTGTGAELKMVRIMQKMKETKFESASGVWASAQIPSRKGWK